MSSSASDSFDASCHPGFQEGVDREFKARKSFSLDDSLGLLVGMPVLLVVLIYVIMSSEAELWQRLVVVAGCACCLAALGTFVVYTQRRPNISPIRITTDGSLTLGRRNWVLRSIGEVELEGHVLVFRDVCGKKLVETYDYQAGDLESFVTAMRRVAPHVVFRVGRETMAARLVRIPKQ